jgi:prevent-host-death family protein
MTRNVSTSDAKAKLSSYMEWAVQHRDGIIIQSHGKPKAVLISYVDYEQFRVWQEEQRRQAALDELERLAEKLRSRNRDLTGAEADEIADRFTREVIEEMVAEGKVKYGDEDA